MSIDLIDTVSLNDRIEFLEEVSRHFDIPEVIEQSPGFDQVTLVDICEIELIEIRKQK